MRVGISRRKSRVHMVIVIPILIIVVLCVVISRLSQAFTSAAHAYANGIATAAVSEAVYETFSEYDDSDFSSIKSENSAVTFNTNTARINMLNSVLTNNLEKKMKLETYHTMYVPIGAASGIDALSAAGPKLPVRIHPVNIVNTDFDEKFESAGINQVRHSVFINVEIKMSYSGYLFFAEEIVSVKVPVTDTVIVGDTPKYYGGVELGIDAESRNFD